MIMNDTCATHRSRVPQRSFGRNKRPGILVCVLCAAVVREGLPLFICVCLFVIKVLNVCRFPPPSSRIYQLHYID